MCTLVVFFKIYRPNSDLTPPVAVFNYVLLAVQKSSPELFVELICLSKNHVVFTPKILLESTFHYR